MRNTLHDSRRKSALAAAALAALLVAALATTHRAHSQRSQEGPPAPLCADRIPLRDGSATWLIPACLNYPLDVPDPQITRAVVGIHGLDRFANAAFGCLVDAGRAVHASSSTLVLAPQFVTEAEKDRYRVGPEAPCWKGSRWIQGDDSVPGDGGRTISSYRVVDLLLERLADARLYPNLHTVIVAGHSGGGQFVQRYAAGTRMADRLRQRGVEVRFVVANPSSYLYLTPERPISGAADFAVPLADVRRRVHYFNNYKYGLDRLNPYMKLAGADRIRSAYRDRKITYLLGDHDNDPRHPQLDRGRAAELEGANRLERGKAFFGYLRHLYGPSVAESQRLEIVTGVAHNARLMFASEAGLRALFGESSRVAAR